MDGKLEQLEARIKKLDRRDRVRAVTSALYSKDFIKNSWPNPTLGGIVDYLNKVPEDALNQAQPG